MTTKETEGHLALANAKQTEQKHLATTNDQIAEWDLSIKNRQAKIESYRDAIRAEEDGITADKAARSKLKRKRIVFQRAAFALDLIDQED